VECFKNNSNSYVWFSALILSLLLLAEKGDASLTLATFNQGKGKVTADVRIAYRYEFWDWFTPQAQLNDNNRYGYSFVRSLFGINITLPNLRGYIQAQDVHMWGLPDDAVANPSVGPLGIGGIYFLHGVQEDYSSTIIRQAYLEIPGVFIDGLVIRGGRFDYVDGMEVTYDNPKVNWIKKIRLAERFTGSFAWSSFNRSFDGFQVVYDKDSYNLTSIITHPTQGGFENDAHETIENIDLATFTLTVKYNHCIPNTEGRFFYFYYNDDRDIPKVDNTPIGSDLNRGNIIIHTLGMHWLGTLKTANGVLDALFWGTYQTGDWGALDHDAWAATVEIGYQFKTYPWTPWIRAGYFVSSGDEDPNDGDHETLYQLLPTVRKYALFPFFNQMNSEDLFLQAILKPMKKLVLRSDIHFLKLHEDDDRWYMGAGPTRESGNIFGYIGRASFGDEKLGTLLDVTMIYKLNPHVSGILYYGHVFGSKVIENIYARDEDGNMAYVELILTF